MDRGDARESDMQALRKATADLETLIDASPVCDPGIRRAAVGLALSGPSSFVGGGELRE